MVDKMQILPLENFVLVMQKLAHFHGRWLTYRWKGEAGSLPQECLFIFHRTSPTPRKEPG